MQTALEIHKDILVSCRCMTWVNRNTERRIIMTKPLISVSITLLSGGNAITAADTATSRVGSAVYAALLAGQDLHFNNGTEYIIPFHAVAMATVTRTTATVEKPADDLCVTE